MITIALSKGRLLQESIPVIKKVGILLGMEDSATPAYDPINTRSLIIKAKNKNWQFLILRAADVPTFVRHGAAQLGIAGKDILLEQDSSDLFQPIDLPIGKCRMSLAMNHAFAKKWQDNQLSGGFPLRVATKYPLITHEWFSKQRRKVQIIKLYGSMEIAPFVGISDAIVDLVSTGATLRENNLKEVEKIENINAKLIVGRASLKTESKKLKPIIEAFDHLK